MKEEGGTKVKSGPSGWAVASQMGLNLVALTCVFAALGYFAGELIGGGFWSISLLLLGMVIGFAGGLYKVYKDSEALNASEPIPPGVKPLDDDDMKQ